MAQQEKKKGGNVKQRRAPRSPRAMERMAEKKTRNLLKNGNVAALDAGQCSTMALRKIAKETTKAGMKAREYMQEK